MKMRNRLLSEIGPVACTLLGAALLPVQNTFADADEIFRVSHPTWKAECGSCHVAYPPQMLPASSWRAIMTQLDRHFGTDASLDAGTAAEIAAFLRQNAGRERRDSSRRPVLRITKLDWFRHEHEEELPASIWDHPAVKTPAHCEACHTRAGDGDYSERSLRVPR
jgi:hypothetical protein